MPYNLGEILYTTLDFGKRLNFRLIFALKVSVVVTVSRAVHVTIRHLSRCEAPGFCCLGISTQLSQGNIAISISHLFDSQDIPFIIKKVVIFNFEQLKGKLFKRYI